MYVCCLESELKLFTIEEEEMKACALMYKIPPPSYCQFGHLISDVHTYKRAAQEPSSAPCSTRKLSTGC